MGGWSLDAERRSADSTHFAWTGLSCGALTLPRAHTMGGGVAWLRPGRVGIPSSPPGDFRKHGLDPADAACHHCQHRPISTKKAPRKAHVPGGQRTGNFSGSDWTLRLPLGPKGGRDRPEGRRGRREWTQAAAGRPCRYPPLGEAAPLQGGLATWSRCWLVRELAPRLGGRDLGPLPDACGREGTGRAGTQQGRFRGLVRNFLFAVIAPA